MMLLSQHVAMLHFILGLWTSNSNFVPSLWRQKFAKWSWCVTAERNGNKINKLCTLCRVVIAQCQSWILSVTIRVYSLTTLFRSVKKSLVIMHTCRLSLEKNNLHLFVLVKCMAKVQKKRHALNIFCDVKLHFLDFETVSLFCSFGWI